MTAQHTAGPWTLLPARTLVNIKGPNGEQIAQLPMKKYSGACPNAARIVACVNACEGIPTDELRPALVAYLNDASAMIALRTERDSLRAAAQSALDLLLDGDAEPEDADRVAAQLREALR